MQIKGIDISRAQQGFDFEAAVSDGVKFVIIRAGIRTDRDSYFDRNVSECEKRGIPYGFYWFFEAVTEEEFDLELAACESVVSAYRPKYPVFFDMETKRQIDLLTTRRRTDMAKKFCQRMTAVGVPSGIYANPAWMESYFYKNELVGKYDIWLAHWTENPNRPSKYDYGQVMWQWGIDNIEGAGDVDGDICFIDYPARTEKWYKENSKPEPNPEPEPEPQPQPKPEPQPQIKIGDTVKVASGARFADGTKPFDYVYTTMYTVMQLSRDLSQALIGVNGQYTGWFYVKDLIVEKENTIPVPATFKVGDRVRVREGATTYDGAPLASFVYSLIYTVMQVGTATRPDYIVIGQDGIITAAVKAKDLILV